MRKTLIERLTDKIERDLGLCIVDGPRRIYGARGAAHRWEVQDKTWGWISCPDTMKEAVTTPKLHILYDGVHKYISVE